jgi:hypothetical protein
MAIKTDLESTGLEYDFLSDICQEDLHPGPFYSVDDEISFALGLSSPPESEMSRARHWCFTLNNYTEDDIQKIMSNEGEVDYLIFGKEVGASGTPHLQGFVSFRNRVRRNTAIQKIGQAHFSVARNLDQAIEYCKKDGDFTELGNRPRGPGSRSDLDEFKAAVIAGELNMSKLRADFSDVVAKYPKFCNDFVQDNIPKKTVQMHPLKPWQQNLYARLRLEPDDRKIFFIVDYDGNAGKSWFGHYYCALHENAQVLLPGKKADMAYSLNPLIRVLFVDAPRSKQGEFIQYDFLEDVKNGYVFSPKYESRVKYLEKVHVVVFMNERPDETKLSRDRFEIVEV